MKIVRCAKCMKVLNEGMAVCPECGFDQNTPQADIALRRYTVLHGRYLVGDMIGKGGFGITYVGLDLTLELKVAIKEYYPSGTASRIHEWSNDLRWNISDETQKKEKNQSIEHFIREARRMARLDGVPGVVRVRDTFQENETAYIVMDFVDGETLKKWVAAHGPMPWEDCQEMLMPIIDSLAIIHDHGFLHRDIAPDNIMICPDGSARLLDMGAAMDMSANDGRVSTVVVKSSFSAPEQYDERAVLGSWTDVYAMAVTIYYCLTGELIPTAIERMMSHAPFPKSEKVPAYVAEILAKALEMEPKNRIRDMHEFKRQLETAAGGTKGKFESKEISKGEAKIQIEKGTKKKTKSRTKKDSRKRTKPQMERNPAEETRPLMKKDPAEETGSLMKRDPAEETRPLMKKDSAEETGPLMKRDPVEETEPLMKRDPVEETGSLAERDSEKETDVGDSKGGKGGKKNGRARKAAMISAALGIALIIAAVLSWLLVFRQTAVPQDYVAYFTFDGTLKDETGNYIATAIGYQLSVASKTSDWSYVEGTVGQAIAINPDGDQVGLNTGVDIGSGSYTVAFTAKALSVEKSASLVWIGRSSQESETWNGFLTGLESAYRSAWNRTDVGFGSGLRSDRIIACANASLNGATETTFEWTSIAFSVNREEDSTVKLYYGGAEVAMAENAAELKGRALLYVGADYWNEPCSFYIDELYVYDRVLTQEEIAAIAKKSGLSGLEVE